MSVPFSNTTLRIPRGFGNLLEGLSREVLREQPRDIIGFAATYFEDLLQKRTDSGIDPADWAAQLEDRFYNNHIFKEKRTTIPENEPKFAPVTIDTAYQEKDRSSLDQAEALEGIQKKCIKKPTHFTSISQQTVSMMLQDKEWHSKQSIVSGLASVTASAHIEPKEGPLEEKSQVLTGAAPEQGPLDDTDSKMIAVAPVEVPMEGTILQITGTGPEEGLLEGTGTQVIAVAPEGSSLEVTDSQLISATLEQGQLEDTASEMISAAPEQGSLEEPASQMIAAPSEESKEDTAAQVITTVSAEDQEEKIQSTEEPSGDTNVNEDQAAVIIQSVYRGYSARKKLKEDTPSPPQADDDLFTEACPGTDGIEYSLGEELAFTGEENTNSEEAVGMTGDETKCRMGTDGLHSTAKDGTAEISICAAELGSPLVKENINTDADICGAELQSAMKEDNKSEPDMATEMARHDICGAELDQKGFFEATSGSSVNVDICGTELGLVATKDIGQEESKSNEIDIKPQDEPGDKVTEEAAHQHEVSGVLNDSQDQAGVDQEYKGVTEADIKVNDNPSTEESQSAEGDSGMVK